jgi:two-component sensor histidine kinase
MAEATSFRERTGGRWAFSLPVWILAATASAVITILTSNPTLQSETGNGRTLAAAGVGTVLMGIVFLGIRWVRPPEHDLSIEVVIALSALIGLVRGLSTAWLLGHIDAHQFAAVAQQLIAPIVFGIVGIPVFNALVEGVQQHRAERDALVARLIELRERQLRQELLSETITEALLANVLTATDEARLQVSERPAVSSHAERQRLADLLRSTATGSVRSLSHVLHERAVMTAIPTTGFVATVRNTLNQRPLWPWQTSLALSVLTFASSLTALVNLSELAFGAVVVVALGAAIVQFALTWTPLAVFLSLSQRGFLPPVMVIIGATVLAVALGLARTVVMLNVFAGAFPNGLIVAQAAIATLAILSVNLALASQRGQAAIMETLRHSIDESEVDEIARSRELARTSRSLAQYVHGTLQSRLLAAALAIEQAERDETPGSFDAAIEQAVDALSLSNALASPSRELAPAVQETVELWSGFATFTITLDEFEPPLAPSVVEDVCLITEEGIANAMRHGRATAIDVVVFKHDEEVVRVVVTDNGIGPQGGPRGFGSALFDLSGANTWSLTRRLDGAGSLLSVRVARFAPYLAPAPD